MPLKVNIGQAIITFIETHPKNFNFPDPECAAQNVCMLARGKLCFQYASGE